MIKDYDKTHFIKLGTKNIQENSEHLRRFLDIPLEKSEYYG